MGIDATIPLGVKTPDTFATIGSLVNIARGQTELARSKVALEQDTGALDARKALAEAVNNPENKNEDGTINLDKFSAAAYKADPKDYLASEYVKRAASANLGVTQLKSAAMSLGDQVQSYLGQRVGALAMDPDVKIDDVKRVLDDTVRIAGPGASSAARLRDIALKQLDRVGDDPKAIRQALTQFRNLAFPVAAQAPQTSFVQTGAAAVPVQTNQLAGQVGPVSGGQAVPNQVGPQGAEQITTDVVGNPVKVVTAPDGRKSFESVQGSPKPLLAFPAGENQQTAATLSQSRQMANDAAKVVPQSRFNNAQILKYVDGALTGAASQGLNGVLTSVGLQKLTGDAGTDYNVLGHFIALEAQNNAKIMGAGTDASRSLSEQATASRTWTREAIKKAVKTNDALATGVGLYNQGLEQAINDPNNSKSIFAARDFQNAWSQNFDVNAVRLLNAKQAGDKNEVAAIVKEVGGKDSKGAQTLANKVRALDSLISTGRLPQ